MRTDELRRELDALAGGEPAVDDAWNAVSTRVRRRRTRTGIGLLAACVLVIGGAVVVRHDSSNPTQVTVRNPPAGPTGNVADFSWTRLGAPYDVTRVVDANGQTFAVGTSNDGTAAISRINDVGAWTTIDPAASYDGGRPGAVTDLVATPDALVAVGWSANAPSGVEHADAWRSTDGGHSWRSVRVEAVGTQPLIRRVAVSDRVVYAVGLPGDASGNLGCPVTVWKSTDGIDFHVVPGQPLCAGPVDAAAGPAGLVITTMDNATAWHRSGDEWSPRSMSNEQGAPVAIAGSEDGYVAVGSTHSGNDIAGAIWWSPDGRTWERVATATSPADAGYRQAQFSSVAHSAAGWIAVGVQVHAGRDLRVSDAIVSTSPDGRHWSPVTRDHGVFEQYARADRVGPTARGFAIVGQANVTRPDTPDTAGGTRSDRVLWFGSARPSPPAHGILEGSLREVGGPAPGLDRGIRGRITIKGPGSRADVTTDDAGRFSIALLPGHYTAVGHSPAVARGTYDCTADVPGQIEIAPRAVEHVDFICPIR